MDRKTFSFREQLELGLRRTVSRNAAARQSTDNLEAQARQTHESIVSPPASQEEVKQRHQAELESLEEIYYQDEFNSVLHELQKLPAYFTKDDLDTVVDARASVMEVVSSTLSEHIMAKYDQFAEGVEEVRQVDSGLQAAYSDVRILRSELAVAAAEVSKNLSVAAKQRRKQGFIALLETLVALQEAAQMHAAFAEAEASCEFAGAFWLAAQCAAALEPIASLRVADELGQSASLLYAGTIQHLESALSAVCADFRPDQYGKVIEGYMYLGGVGTLGEEVVSTFTGAISSAATKTVRGIIVGRLGLEDKARSTAIFGELVKLLPADLFRPCLAQVMMVLDRASAPGSPGPNPLMNGSHTRSASVSDLADRLRRSDSGAVRADDEGQSPSKEAVVVSPLEAEAAELAEQEQQAAAFGEALTSVSDSLTAGRRRLWEEAARKLGALLSAPAAFQGEHFLRVLDWTQTMLTVGEAFSGAESSTLRDAISRQSGRFFQAYHAANLQALHAMLEQELWQRLPMDGTLPSLVHVLEGGGSSDALATTSFHFDTNSFAAWVAHGNPWRKQDPSLETGQESPDPGSMQEDSDDEDDAPELYGDAIDEDSQRVTTAADRTGRTSTSGRLDDGPALTLSARRLLQWVADYGGLMRAQRSRAGHVFSGMAELFELYLLHAFHTFADVPLDELAQGKHLRLGAADKIPVRLKNAILRILSRSLTKYRAYYLPAAPPPGQAGAPNANRQQPSRPPPAAHTALIHPGNMYGLQERKVAADSLRKLASFMTQAASALMEALTGCTDIPDQHAPEVFFQTVKAATDLVEVVFRTAARLNVQLGWVPERLSEGNFNLEEPPERASPWVGVLLNHLANWRQKLDTATSLTAEDMSLLWGESRTYVSEMLLDGIARAGVKSKCTTMGRSAMSLDLQAIQRGLQQLEPGDGGSEAVVDALRIVDAYIKAFYLPWGPELRHWCQTHPEYTRPQLLALVSCIADSNNLKRKDRAALLAQIEADLADVRVGR
ncbi:hypothetical protein WJX73_003160 [Symbiochloris irregularis]|uniref:Uncharacterized protein n=1 Tax=Symbiochloris irregularis TaxID=706552 RepID=A0AAW1P7F2_9CHLO